MLDNGTYFLVKRLCGEDYGYLHLETGKIVVLKSANSNVFIQKDGVGNWEDWKILTDEQKLIIDEWYRNKEPEKKSLSIISLYNCWKEECNEIRKKMNKLVCGTYFLVAHPAYYLHLETGEIIKLADLASQFDGNNDCFQQEAELTQLMWRDLTDQQKLIIYHWWLGSKNKGYIICHFCNHWRHECKEIEKGFKKLEDLPDGYYQVSAVENKKRVRNLLTGEIIEVLLTDEMFKAELDNHSYFVKEGLKITGLPWLKVPGNCWKVALTPLEGSLHSLFSKIVETVEDLPTGNYQEIWYTFNSYAVRAFDTEEVFLINSPLSNGEPFFSKNGKLVVRFAYDSLLSEFKPQALISFPVPPGASKIFLDPDWGKIWIKSEIDNLPFVENCPILVGKMVYKEANGASQIVWIYKSYDGQVCRGNDPFLEKRILELSPAILETDSTLHFTKENLGQSSLEQKDDKTFLNFASKTIDPFISFIPPGRYRILGSGIDKKLIFRDLATGDEIKDQTSFGDYFIPPPAKFVEFKGNVYEELQWENLTDSEKKFAIKLPFKSVELPLVRGFGGSNYTHYLHEVTLLEWDGDKSNLPICHNNCDMIVDDIGFNFDRNELCIYTGKYIMKASEKNQSLAKKKMTEFNKYSWSDLLALPLPDRSRVNQWLGMVKYENGDEVCILRGESGLSSIMRQDFYNLPIKISAEEISVSNAEFIPATEVILKERNWLFEQNMLPQLYTWRNLCQLPNPVGNKKYELLGIAIGNKESASEIAVYRCGKEITTSSLFRGLFEKVIVNTEVDLTNIYFDSDTTFTEVKNLSPRQLGYFSTATKPVEKPLEEMNETLPPLTLPEIRNLALLRRSDEPHALLGIVQERPYTFSWVFRNLKTGDYYRDSIAFLTEGVDLENYYPYDIFCRDENGTSRLKIENLSPIERKNLDTAMKLENVNLRELWKKENDLIQNAINNSNSSILPRLDILAPPAFVYLGGDVIWNFDEKRLENINYFVSSSIGNKFGNLGNFEYFTYHSPPVKNTIPEIDANNIKYLEPFRFGKNYQILGRWNEFNINYGYYILLDLDDGKYYVAGSSSNCLKNDNYINDNYIENMDSKAYKDYTCKKSDLSLFHQKNTVAGIHYLPENYLSPIQWRDGVEFVLNNETLKTLKELPSLGQEVYIKEGIVIQGTEKTFIYRSLKTGTLYKSNIFNTDSEFFTLDKDKGEVAVYWDDLTWSEKQITLAEVKNNFSNNSFKTLDREEVWINRRIQVQLHTLGNKIKDASSSAIVLNLGNGLGFENNRIVNFKAEHADTWNGLWKKTKKMIKTTLPESEFTRSDLLNNFNSIRTRVKYRLVGKIIADDDYKEEFFICRELETGEIRWTSLPPPGDFFELTDKIRKFNWNDLSTKEQQQAEQLLLNEFPKKLTGMKYIPSSEYISLNNEVLSLLNNTRVEDIKDCSSSPNSQEKYVIANDSKYYLLWVPGLNGFQLCHHTIGVIGGDINSNKIITVSSELQKKGQDVLKYFISKSADQILAPVVAVLQSTVAVPQSTPVPLEINLGIAVPKFTEDNGLNLSLEAKAAGYRVAVGQIQKVFQQFLAQQLPDNLHQLLGSEVSVGLMNWALGYYLAGQSDVRWQQLGSEFRVSAMTGVANSLIEELFSEVLKAIPQRIELLEETEELMEPEFEKEYYVNS